PSYVGVRHDVAWPAQAPAPSPTPAPAPTPAPTPVATSGRAARVFVKDGQSWQIELRGASHVQKRSRGDAVETTSTSFPRIAAAWRDADQRIKEKIDDGYAEVDEG